VSAPYPFRNSQTTPSNAFQEIAAAKPAVLSIVPGEALPSRASIIVPEVDRLRAS
jgi:hypothetical protein